MGEARSLARITVVLLASALVIVSSFAGVALAKGATLSQPPITIGLHVSGGTADLISQAQASSLGSIILDIPRLYNSSWEPAIQNFAVAGNKSLGGVWLDRIGLWQDPPYRNGSSVLTVSFGAVVNDSERIVNRIYSGDSELAQNLKVLNASLTVEISAFGPDFTPSYIGELFAQTDAYFHAFNSVAGQVSQMVGSQTTGKYFGWLLISLLDGSTVRLDTNAVFPTTYFGPVASTGLVTRTVTMSVSKSDTGDVVSSWSYGIAGLGVAALGGAIVLFMASKRRVA